MTILFPAGKYRSELWKDSQLAGDFCLDQAVDGEDMVKKVRVKLKKEGQYDLIFINRQFPDADGKTVLESVRNLENESGIVSSSGAVIVMTSDLWNKKEALAAFSEGCDYYLPLPADQEMLSAIIETTKNDLELRRK